MPASILFLAFCLALSEPVSGQLMGERRESGKHPFVSVACRAHPPHGRAVGCPLSIPALGMHQSPGQSSSGLASISKLELCSSQASLCRLAALSLLAQNTQNQRRKAALSDRFKPQAEALLLHLELCKPRLGCDSVLTQ